jgi:hypothetical protein
VVRGRPEPDPALVERVGHLAAQLPEVVEEDAWTGVRWRVRRRTFAHVAGLHHEAAHRLLGVRDGRPVTAVTVRSRGAELAALRAAGPPYLPGWGDDGVLLVLDDRTDWVEVAELLTESHRLLAPARLAARLEVPDVSWRPGSPGA